MGLLFPSFIRNSLRSIHCAPEQPQENMYKSTSNSVRVHGLHVSLEWCSWDGVASDGGFDYKFKLQLHLFQRIGIDSWQ